MIPHEIIDKDGYSVAKCAGGCNFVFDKDNPHLGGNLEYAGIDKINSEILFPFIMDRFNPKTLLDVGCAEGCDMEWFAGQGIFVEGIDGLKRNVEVCKNKELNVVEFDYTKSSLTWASDMDMVLCFDVLEHIEERFLPNIFETFKCGKVLIIAHGLEGNESTGWHHVTNKTNQWWIDRIKEIGFEYDKELSEYSRSICKQGWYFLSGKIFYRI